MLKKLAIAAMISSFAIASFAQAGAAPSTPAKSAKHVTHHIHKKAASKSVTPAAAK